MPPALDGDSTSRGRSTETERTPKNKIAARALAPRPSTPSRKLSGCFVGREPELEELRAGLENAVAGRGRLYLISGESGIGKSRLAEEVAAEATRREFLVLWGRSWQGEGTPPYWPWVQMMRGLVGGAGMAAGEAAVDPGLRLLAQVTPEPEGVPSGTDELPAVQSEHARFHFFDSVTQALREASGRRPILLVLDDLHAACRSSLLLLDFLGRQLLDSRIVVIGTYSEEEVRRRPRLFDVLADIGRESRWLRLRPLTARAIASWVETAIGPSRPAAFADDLHEITRGNPLFVDALLRILAHRADDDLERTDLRSLGLPDEVSDAIRRRLRSLPEDSRAILSIAAMIGHEFNRSLVEHAYGQPPDHVSDALEDAVHLGVVVRISDSSDRYRFCHTFFRETLDDVHPATARADLHRRLGEAIERLVTDAPEHRLAQLACHFLEAGSASDLRKALDYGSLAGTQALRELGYDEAVRHYQRALQASERIGDGGDETRCEILLQLGCAQTMAGELAAARTTLDRAAELARELHDTERFARAALGFSPFAGVAIEHRIPLLEEALRTLPDEDSIVRARLLARLAEACHADGAADERSVRLARDAVEMARRIGDPAALAAALRSEILTCWNPEKLPGRIAIADDLARLGTELGLPEWTFEGHVWAAATALRTGDVGLAKARIAVIAELPDSRRHRFFTFATKELEGLEAVLEGRFEEAERSIEDVERLGRSLRFVDAEAIAAAQRFVLAWERGDAHDFDVLEKIARRAPGFLWKALLACAYAGAGREEEARSSLDLLVSDRVFPRIPRNDEWLSVVALLADTCARLGDSGPAPRLYEALEPFASHAVVLGVATASLGSTSRFLASLAALMGRSEDAARHFEEALRLNRQMGARPWLAIVEREYASFLLDRGAPGDREKASTLRSSVGETARLVEHDQRPAGPGRPARVETPLDEDVFRREGRLWLVRFGGTTIRLGDVKGLQYIAYLLARPGEDVHVTVLASLDSGEETHPPEATHVSRGLGHAGDILDQRAKSEYGRRLKELHSDLEEARTSGDASRAEALREETEILSDEVRAAFGAHGRPRRSSDVTERIRKAVASRIFASIARLETDHPLLGEHLRTAIHLGAYCSYAPGKTIRWSL
jgi:tetratricopeptide (TPR) repeat protein